jgi:hypothetical protein
LVVVQTFFQCIERSFARQGKYSHLQKSYRLGKKSIRLQRFD